MLTSPPRPESCTFKHDLWKTSHTTQRSTAVYWSTGKCACKCSIVVFTTESFMLKLRNTARHLNSSTRQQEAAFWSKRFFNFVRNEHLTQLLLLYFLNHLENYYFLLSFSNISFYLMTPDTLHLCTKVKIFNYIPLHIIISLFMLKNLYFHDYHTGTITDTSEIPFLGREQKALCSIKLNVHLDLFRLNRNLHLLYI